jgi:hypothetical protein
MGASIDATQVMYSRWRWLSLAAWCGVITVLGAIQEIASPSVAGVTFAVLCGGTVAIGLSFGLRRRPAVGFDHEGLTLGRSGRFVPWSTVSVIRINVEQTMYGLKRFLVLELVPLQHPSKPKFFTGPEGDDKEVEVSLDWLSMPWTEVASLLERASGRRVLGLDNEQRSGHSDMKTDPITRI